MNFPKKQNAIVFEPERIRKQDEINRKYDQKIADVNAEMDGKVGQLNKQISDNNSSKGVSFGGILGVVGLVVGFFVCTSKCNNDGKFFDCLGAWILIAVIGLIIGSILDKLATGAAKADTKNCNAQIASLNNSREDKIGQLNNLRDSESQTNTLEYQNTVNSYQRNFTAAVEKHKQEMYGRTEPVYVERMDDLVADVGNILANQIKAAFHTIARDPSGDFVNQFVTEFLSFHVFSNGVAFQAGTTSFTFMEKGLLDLGSDEETFARAAVIAERVVSYVQGLSSEAMDESGREYAPGRQVSLSFIEDVYNDASRFNWEIYDNKFDMAGAAYVKVVITCRCVNSKYAPPV